MLRKLLSSAVVPLLFTLQAPSALAKPDLPQARQAAIPAGFVSRSADLDGVTIHYVSGGSGPVLLLIHGWPETWYAWHRMLPALAARHTVIAVDYRGAGDSSIPAAGYDKATMAGDLYRLMHRLGHSQVTLVAHDWGVPIAYAYAAAHRGEVDRFIAIDGGVEGAWTSEAAKQPYWFFGFQGIPGLAEKVVAGHERTYLDWFYRDKSFHAVPMQEQEIAGYEQSFSRPGRMKAGFELYRTTEQDIAQTNQVAQPPLDIPVLAIGAERGIGKAVASMLANVATNVTPVLMHGTGHFVSDEQPEALTRLIEDFIAGAPIAPDWSPAAR